MSKTDTEKQDKESPDVLTELNEKLGPTTQTSLHPFHNSPVVVLFDDNTAVVGVLNDDDRLTQGTGYLVYDLFFWLNPLAKGFSPQDIRWPPTNDYMFIPYNKVKAFMLYEGKLASQIVEEAEKAEKEAEEEKAAYEAMSPSAKDERAKEAPEKEARPPTKKEEADDLDLDFDGLNEGNMHL